MRFLLIKQAEEWAQSGILGHQATTSSVYPPLGLLYVAATLEQLGQKVKILDCGQEVLSKESLGRLLNDTDVVGLSLYTNNYQQTAECAHSIKDIAPDMPIVLGGPHCIFSKYNALYDVPSADICVDAEAETVMADLIDALQGKKQLPDIPGIHYRKGTTVKSGLPSQVVTDLDSLPFPARHLTDHYDYGNHPTGIHFKKKFTSMITSRGCAFRCRFCAKYGNVIPRFDFRQRSAENIVEEILEIKDRYRSISIVDDNFLADRKRSHRIFDMLLESGITNDLLIIGARVDTAEKRLYEKMRKAGVKYISYGIESGNQETLDFYQKKITLSQIRNAVKLARKMGFFISSTFIFGGPIETKKHLQKTTKFLCSLPLDTAVIRPFFYEKGAELYSQAVSDGKISKDEWAVRVDVKRKLGLLRQDEVDASIRNAYRRFYIRPSYVAGQLVRALRQGDLDRLRNTIRIATTSQIKNVL